jgi:DNA-directed RNA polymerase subunit E"
MSEKACTDCRTISQGPVCPNCKSTSLSDDFSGLAIIFNPEKSVIAKAIGIKDKGRYALRVR